MLTAPVRVREAKIQEFLVQVAPAQLIVHVSLAYQGEFRTVECPKPVRLRV